MSDSVKKYFSIINKHSYNRNQLYKFLTDENYQDKQKILPCYHKECFGIGEDLSFKCVINKYNEWECATNNDNFMSPSGIFYWSGSLDNEDKTARINSRGFYNNNNSGYNIHDKDWPL